MDFGLGTFGDVTVDAEGEKLSYAEVLRDIVDQAVLADSVGVRAFAVGEHHRDDYAVTAPEVVLAAAASRTKQILLATGVTVLSSDDPIRVFERFATLDALSNGRAEVQLGRGSFTESFPLYGLDLADYEVLFNEKLDLFSRLLDEEPVTWEGTIRPPLREVEVFPKTESGRLRTWIGVGGSPESVIRAARYGIPMMLAIIGGSAHRFAPYADLYRRATRELGTGDLLNGELPVGVHSPGHIAATDEQARDELFPHFKANRDRIGRERGWPPTNRAEFEAEVEDGALYVGSPETVARKIAATAQALSLERFDLKYANGAMPHEQLMSSIELYGTKVIPMVRELLA
ncbi:LLM class flavin-dependent oxidoreductase [Blastococcus sp. Marseille-P5729]|uniref:LLM class flavin-dependent oxidoreductase n=1 Tax=Blastococcus sp. Marseille-P5729 TaxID=2086582 RepID=UPI000D0F95A8|nr:LLM class flavin-dependent oxidoreductase [Blastococcus sp. Marseille-P5729]